MDAGFSKFTGRSALSDADNCPIGPDNDPVEKCHLRNGSRSHQRSDAAGLGTPSAGNNGEASKEGKDGRTSGAGKNGRKGFLWKGDPAWELERLWAEGSTQQRRIAEPPIAEGHQTLLAGEPKCGKSLLASQLCPEIASAGTSKGSRVLRLGRPDASKVNRVQGRLLAGPFKIRSAGEERKNRWTVRYVSFEMDRAVMWGRASRQAMGIIAVEPALAFG